jgi:hypothetical protein
VKTATLITADIFTGKPLTTSESFYKPVMELIQRFYEEKNLFIPKDTEKSPMMIGAEFTYDVKQWGSKDTIIVSRGQIAAGGHPGMKATEGVNFKDGAKTYHDTCQGPTLVRIVSLDHVEEISDQVFDLLWLLKIEVKKAGIFQMNNLVMAKPALASNGAKQDLKIVQISFDSVMERRWKVTPDAPLLQGVNYDVVL